MDKKEYIFLLGEICQALEDQSYEASWYLNITQQKVDCISDYEIENEIFPEDDDQLLKIDPMFSSEAFSIMEDFAESVKAPKIQARLFRALQKRHPFSNFKDQVYDEDLEKEWFAYKDKRMNEYAEAWLKENEVVYKDGQLIFTGKICFIFNKQAFLDDL